MILDHKKVLKRFGYALLAFVYALLLIVTCSSVWNAAAGNQPDIFCIVCSVLHFSADGFILGYTLRKYFKQSEQC